MYQHFLEYHKIQIFSLLIIYIYTLYILNNFIQGVGNQLFVYCFGIICSRKYNIPYFHSGISELNIKSNLHEKQNNKLACKKIISFENFINGQFSTDFNYELCYSPNIEDYKLFYSNIDLLKLHVPFTKLNIRSDDLIYHFRAGDFLLNNNHYLLRADNLKSVIEKITYNNLYVVSNLFTTNEITIQDYDMYIKNYLKNKGDCGSFDLKQATSISNSKKMEVISTFNKMINLLNSLNCIWISDSIYNVLILYVIIIK